MKGSNYAESCFACHESLAKTPQYPHKPYAQGQCQKCHSPHNADNYQLLNTAADKLCHAKGDIARVHKNFPVAIKTCQSCHNPHGSDNKGMIRTVRHEPFTDDCTICHDGTTATVSQEVCLECHEEDVGENLRSTHNHLASTGGNSCINCHTPHAADTERLLKYRLKALPWIR